MSLIKKLLHGFLGSNLFSKRTYIYICRKHERDKAPKYPYCFVALLLSYSRIVLGENATMAEISHHTSEQLSS